MEYKYSIYWFRKSLRLHDNPSLLYAISKSEHVFPIFILDPYFVSTAKVGANRWRFLIQSLQDLDQNLKKLNSSLLILKGSPIQTLETYIKKWDITLLCFEKDTEPYSKIRDSNVEKLSKSLNFKIYNESSHTLYDLEYLFIQNDGKVPLTYTSFLNLIQKVGDPSLPSPAPSKSFKSLNIDIKDFQIPTLEELKITGCGPLLYLGGENEALSRLNLYLKNKEWICAFEKPKTSPNSIKPSTTVLSPYLKFGCLSSRVFFYELKNIYKSMKKHSEPPVSLLGQLYWREFFYLVGAFTSNFDKMIGNPICKQIDWDKDDKLVELWKNAKTGFPLIDAIMTQLKQEGWIHHLARHSVACFLTRGDLYQSWEKGLEVFEEWLLDADWSLNAANWMWLSASSFFYQYYRVYSPIEFGKKTDKNGDYIKKYLPILKKIPKEFIYEPWEAPLYVQEKAGCVIGKDYPFPIVNHKEKMRENIERMKQSYSKINSSQMDEELPTKTLKKIKYK